VLVDMPPVKPLRVGSTIVPAGGVMVMPELTAKVTVATSLAAAASVISDSNITKTAKVNRLTLTVKLIIFFILFIFFYFKIVYFPAFIPPIAGLIFNWH
jgi:glucan phosphoethanolaminetransferase (alkaline phosphatase superfamily)